MNHNLSMPAHDALHMTPSADTGQQIRVLRTHSFCAALLLALSVSTAAAPGASQLKSQTRQAFDRYVQLTDARNRAELDRASNLLWIDSLPEVQSREAYDALRRGEVKLQKLQTQDQGAPVNCPSGLIHHWVGVVFLPGATVDEVLRILQDYDHHSSYFAPDVERSKILLHDADHFRVYLRFRRHKIITAVLNTEHDVQYFRDAPDRAHSRSSAARIAEVEDAGKEDEREKPPGQDSGYLWGMETWWRIEERDGGVYLQSEVASLTRNIPTGLGWMIGPFVNGIPRETLTFTLDAARKAIQHLSAGR